MKYISSLPSKLTCKRLWIITVTILCAICLTSVDWTLADRVIREFDHARERDTIRTQVFGGKMNWIVSVNQPVGELLPAGTPKNAIIYALGDAFNLKDVTTSRPDLRDGFVQEYGDFDNILCGSYKNGGTFSDSYSLCLLFDADVLIGLDARAVFQHL